MRVILCINYVTPILTLTPGTQALLAMGLLQLRPWKPRTVGALGVIASAMNCYMLFPAMPRIASKDAGTKLTDKEL